MPDLKYRISGRQNFLVPVVEQTDREQGTESRIPEWLVRIDDLTESKNPKFQKHVELFGWYGESSKRGKPQGTGLIAPTGTLRHSELVIIVGVEAFLAELQTRMNGGKPITEVEILHVMNEATVQSIRYLVCNIQSIQQELDRAVIKLNVGVKVDRIVVFNAAGMPAGQKVSSTDYTTGMLNTFS